MSKQIQLDFYWDNKDSKFVEISANMTQVSDVDPGPFTQYHIFYYFNFPVF
jgi:hypothetical protein